MPLDSYCCAVCGSTEWISRMWDETCEATLCVSHRRLVEATWKTKGMKQILRELGVKFSDEPMDLNLSDEDFCKACGIRLPEVWEMYSAMAEINGIVVEEEDDLFPPKPKKLNK